MKRIKPLYKHIIKAGESSFKSVNNLLSHLRTGGGDMRDDDLVMSPYSELIPLEYLFLNAQNRQTNRYSGISEANYKKLSEGLLRDMLSYNMNLYRGDFKNDEFLKTLFVWIEEDETVSVREIKSSSRRVWNEHDIVSNLNNTPNGLRYYGRGWNLFHTFYSLYLDNNNRVGGAIPEILAVVLPENYLYQKYKILMDGQIDMSKVIILVNKDLSTTAYDSPPFKKWWRKYMLQPVMDSGADVWEVPREYIRENCFMKKFSLSGMNIHERKRAKEDIVNAFCEYMQQGNTLERGNNTAVNTAYTDLSINFDAQDLLMDTLTVSTTSAQNGLSTWTYNVGEGNEAPRYTAGADPIREAPISLVDLPEMRQAQMEYNQTMNQLQQRLWQETGISTERQVIAGRGILERIRESAPIIYTSAADQEALIEERGGSASEVENMEGDTF